jgi:hypothetical protein
MSSFAWFRPWGWVYRPVSAAGWLAVFGAAAFCARVFFVVDRHSHSASDTLYGVFPYLACCFLMLNWLASCSCGAPGERERTQR